MKIIRISFLDRGPKVESTMGVLIILIITGMMLFATHSAYRNFTAILEKNISYMENNSNLGSYPSELK